MYAPIFGTGDGTAPVVNLTWPFLDKAFVKASVNGVGVGLTWTGPTQVTFSAPVAADATWEVFRDTQVDTPLADFNDGAVLTAGDLDLARDQVLHHAQEVAYIAGIVAGIPGDTIIGNKRANPADATPLTGAEVTALLSLADASNKGLIPPLSGNITDGLRGDGTFGPAPEGPMGPPGDVAKVDTRAAMAAIAASNRNTRWLAEAGRQGLFQFDSSDLSAMVAADTRQAIYVAPASDPDGSSGAWVRQFDRTILPGWFGWVADDEDGVSGTDNSAAFLAMQRMLEALSIESLGPGFGGNPLAYRGTPYELLLVGAAYVGTATLDFLATATVRGLGGIGPQAATRLRFAEDTTGYRTQSYNTSGANTVDGVEHFSGDVQVIRDIFFLGAYNSAAPNEGEYHGAHLKRPAIIERSTFYNFQGDGLHEDTTGPSGGLTDLTKVKDSAFIGNRHGRWAKGGDSNASTYINNSYRFNRAWGILAENFLISNEIAPHIDGNGIVTGMPAYTQVAVGTHRYAVVIGQEAWAIANAPSGGTTDNTGWYYVGEGGEIAGVVPAWTAGLPLRSGGPIATTNTNNAMNIVGPYVESGQGPAQIAYPTIIPDASGMSSGIKGYGVAITNFQGWMRVGMSGRGIIVEGSSTLNGTVTVDGGTGSGLLEIDGDGAFPQLNFKENGTTYGYLLAAGSDFIINGTNSIGLRRDGVTIANILTGGFDIAAGKVLSINGTAVLNGQMAAQADSSAADVATLKADFNALLAKLRTVKLLAP